MSDLPTPQASRLRPPSWRDTRLVVGILLVLGSVVLGTRVVAAADDTVPVWATRGPVAAGETLDTGDLQVVRVLLADVGREYLPASEELAEGSIAVRSISGSELLPRSAVGTPDDLDRSPVSVPLEATSTAGLERGALVDAWVSQRIQGSRSFAAPVRVASAVEIASVEGGEGSDLVASGDTAVRVLLAETELRSVLDALANDDSIAIVPSAGAGATEVVPAVPDAVLPQEPDVVVPQEPDVVVPQEPDVVVPQEPDAVAPDDGSAQP